MAHKALVLALGLIIAGSPALASDPTTPAPPGTPTTKYCLRVTITGNISDRVECWTRDEWAAQDVDVDREWAANGVGTLDS
jgi:hypothetical protein